jgi:Uma2 family endonuclease
MSAVLRAGAVARKFTSRDYWKLPGDGRRYELLDGDLVVTPPPTTLHQHTSTELVRILGNHIISERLGRLFHAPVAVILADDCVVEPDLVFVAASRRAIIKPRGIEGPPDLTIEILSKGTARRDRTTKARLYARFGVPHFWLIDPVKRSLETYERGTRGYRRTALHAGDAVVRPAPFADLRLDLRDLWA